MLERKTSRKADEAENQKSYQRLDEQRESKRFHGRHCDTGRRAVVFGSVAWPFVGCGGEGVMPVPASINDLSTTAASNSPSGGENPNEGDNYLRALSAFIATLRDKLNGTADTGTVKNATFSGSMAGAASWASLQTFAAGVNVGNVASATTTTLDWYEEGTFTPGVLFGATSTGITYTSRSGTFTRIGDRVFFEASIVLSSKGSATGDAFINGLPYAAGADCGAAVNYYTGMTWTGAPVCFIGSGTTKVALQNFGASTSNALSESGFLNTTHIIVSGNYKV